MAFGTKFTLDTVAQELSDLTVSDIDESMLWTNLSAYFEAHSLVFNESAEQIAERTTQRERIIGGTLDLVAQELDAFGQPSAQKSAIEGYNVGFPLRRYGLALQWNRFAFERMSAAEFVSEVNAITDADEQTLYAQIRRAIFAATNYTFKDRLQPPVINLSVKALVNADGNPIAAGPGGQTFDGSTHTHYMGVATANTPLNSEVEALIDTVVEHFNQGEPILAINKAEETDVAGLSGFKEFQEPGLVNQTAGIIAAGVKDMNNTYDRAIGRLHGAVVWVKPWIPAGYMFAYIPQQSPPLVMRQSINAAARNLRLVAMDENYPLRANEWEHQFGFGVWNRLNGAVLDTVTGSSTYTTPSL